MPDKIANRVADSFATPVNYAPNCSALRWHAGGRGATHMDADECEPMSASNKMDRVLGIWGIHFVRPPQCQKHGKGGNAGRNFLVVLGQLQEAAKLRRENAQLREAAADAAIAILRNLASLTSKLFGGDVLVSEDCDPEFPEDKYTVLAVTTALDPKSAVAAEQQWIRSLRQISPSTWEAVRLSISFKTNGR